MDSFSQAIQEAYNDFKEDRMNHLAKCRKYEIQLGRMTGHPAGRGRRRRNTSQKLLRYKGDNLYFNLGVC
ncbi:MAG: hypothetical protein ACXVHT_12060 [Methanobacterium sp.]